MAVVLDHGNVPVHPAHMHPFFRSTKIENAVAQQAHRIRTGSDGTDDDDESSNANAGSNCEPILHEFPPPPLSSSVANHLGGPWTVSDDALELENTRVKRRRVSVEPIQPLHEVGTSTTTSQATWHEQLEDAAQTSIEARGEGSEAGRPTCRYAQIKEEDVSQPASRSTGEPHPALPTSSTAVEIDTAGPSVYQAISTDGAMDDPPLKRTKASATPKKKMLIGEQGKLNFAAKTSLRRSPRSAKLQSNNESNGTKKTTRSSKKVEMKHGKLVSAMRVSLPYSAPDSGARIDEILSGKASDDSTGAPMAQVVVPSSKSAPPKITHPFFLGKTTVKMQDQSTDLKSEPSSVVATSEDETKIQPSVEAPKAWKDIVFGSKKPALQTAASLPPAWPPLSIQHIHPSQNARPTLPVCSLQRKDSSKMKERASRLRNDEDILLDFSAHLRPDRGPQHVEIPSRSVMTGKALLELVESRFATDFTNPSSSLKVRIQSTSSCFDRGIAAGPHMWAHEYAPRCWQDVLESQCKVLHDWLSSLRVQQVQNGKSQNAKAPIPKKRRRKRKSDDLDDFIAESDDDIGSTGGGKNAILLVGPPGSGKTASVFAAAHQLDFEVFEIHPGMRRSGRDIEDKVGDMTRNHLVLPSSTLSRDSSVSIDDRALLTHGPLPPNQKTMAGFMKPQRGKQSNAMELQNSKTAATTSQKQSLILFEEVDILFEDDRGFWTQVQHLNRTSKRPLILTCNDTNSIPLEELDLFTVLHYKQPDPQMAVQHLGHIAAAEGHLLSKQALHHLYHSKGQDLRAAITELSLWCQMTVGSHQGGLDWMLPYDEKSKSNSEASVTRIVSHDTYTSGLDLLPERFEDVEDLIRFTQDSLDIQPLNWVADDVCSTSESATRLTSLDDMLTFSDAKSALDLFDGSTAPILAGMIRKLASQGDISRSTPRDGVVSLHLDSITSSHPTLTHLTSVFDPLLDESRIGLPTAPGRKAASLDNLSSPSIITEIAPFVRSIVSHDKRLEELRNELHGSSQNGVGANKRQRRTRAARAALEGGSKVTTRREKWFPEALDWDAVLNTGKHWPTFRESDAVEGYTLSRSVSAEETPMETPSSSMATEVEVDV